MEDMQHKVMGYDRTATTFAPDGHIIQVEYAEKTVKLGSASIGIVCKEGVILVSDKRVRDKLVVESSVNKIFEVDEHILATASGILSDARVLIDKGRVLAQQHRVTYDSEPTTESIVKDIANVKQQFTQYGGGRPFGVALMFAGYNGEPSLYVTDVSGNYLRFKAEVIGENDEKLREKLRQGYKEDMTIKEAIKFALQIFKEVLGKDFAISRFDVAYINKEKKIERVSSKELEKYQ